MTTDDREREFSRRALLRAGWSVPLALGAGALAAACGGGGGHEDLGQEILDLTRENRRKDRKGTASTTSTSTTSTSTTTTTTPGSSTTATSRGASGGSPPHGDAPRATTRVHTDTPHGDSAAVANPHTDQHGDVPESLHDDILAYERGEGDRYVTIPHVDTPHADVPHIDAPHTDIAHGDA